MNGGIQIGIGQGAAQVFNTFRYTQAIQQQLDRNEAKEKQEQQEIASLLSKYSTEGMRDADKGAFYKLYNDYKNLYMSNRELYSRPAEHPEQYMQAEAIKQQMDSLSSKSKGFKQLEGTVGTELFQNRFKYRKGTIENWKRWGNMGVYDISKENSGRLPTRDDVVYKPEEPDHEMLQKKILGLATRAGMVEQKDHTDRGTGEQGNGIPIGKASFRTDKFIKPEVIGMATNALWADDGKERYWYENTYEDLKNSDPDQLKETEEHANKILNTHGFKIHDAKSMAYADLLIRNQTIPGEKKLIDDDVYKSEQERLKHDRDRREKQADMFQQHKYRLEEKKAGKKDEEAANNEMIKEVHDMQGALQQRNYPQIRKSLHSLISHPDNTRVPEIIDPVALGESGFRNKLKVVNAMNKLKQFQIPEDQIADMIKRGIPAVVMYQKPGKGEDKTLDEDGNEIPVTEKALVLNPGRSSFDRLVLPMIKKSKVALSKPDRAEGSYDFDDED